MYIIYIIILELLYIIYNTIYELLYNWTIIQISSFVSELRTIVYNTCITRNGVEWVITSVGWVNKYKYSILGIKCYYFHAVIYNYW